ncbi:hypothetical protein Tco_0424405 [Tanacetum coccineum]
MGDTVKDMTAKFGKLDKFEGNDFRRWQKKIHFLLTTLKVVYVLSTPMPEFVEDETLEQTKKRCKWENDDYICRGHILNDMSDALFDVYQNVGSAKELCDQLESKYMAEDASSKKFLVNNFNNYKMVDSSIIDKLPPSWKDFKHSLKHNNDELSLVQLGSHFRIEETLRAKESGKGKGKEIVGSSSVNMIEDGKNKNNKKNNKAKKRKNDGVTCHACKDRCWFITFHPVQDGYVLHMGVESTKPILGHGNVVLEFSSGKTITLVNVVYVSGLRKNLMAVVRLLEPKRKILGEKGIDCIFIGYVEHSKAYRFYVIEPNEYISVNLVIESRDAMFDEKRFTLIPRPKSRMPSSNEDKIGETLVETHTVRMSNRARVSKSFGSDFQLYLVEGSRDEIRPQYSYCYSIEEDPRTFDEATQSRGVASEKKQSMMRWI